MAEMSMVEKVARAIYIEWSRDAGKEESWEELVQHGHSFVDLARREARAAIEAMRDLSPELKAAGAAAFFSPLPTTTQEENERAGSVFRRVIDAALNGKEG